MEPIYRHTFLVLLIFNHQLPESDFALMSSVDTAQERYGTRQNVLTEIAHTASSDFDILQSRLLQGSVPPCYAVLVILKGVLYACCQIAIHSFKIPRTVE